MIKGERLKELRKSKNLTQKELGDILGVTKASICCYEKETRTPTLENVLSLMEYFGVSSDYLIGNDVFVSIKDEPNKTFFMTKEEVDFIEKLRKDKFISNILLTDVDRGIELIKNKIG